MYSVLAKDGFRQELYQEHLEEASFLYEQRRNLLAGDEVEWLRVGDFEERLQAHLDGLVVGGKVALQIAEKRTMEGEPGELHAAVRLFCRQDCRQTVLKLLESVDLSVPAKLEAISAALQDELPNAWHEEFLTCFRANPGKLAPAVMPAFVSRRMVTPPEVADALQAMDGDLLLGMLRILGRTGDTGVCGLLAPYTRSEEPGIREQATIALLRLGDDETRRWLIGLDPREAWAAVPLALCGGPSALEWLVRSRAKGGAKEDFCRGIGLLGDARGVEALLAELNDTAAGAAAAKALDDLTGAVSDWSGAAFESAAAKARTGSKLGSRSKQKDALDPATWTRWWQEHRGDYLPGLRYHGGRPASPWVALNDLGSPRATCRDRAIRYDELAIRYGLALPAESEAPVDRQLRALQEELLRTKAASGRFREGVWYFAGREVSR